MKNQILFLCCAMLFFFTASSQDRIVGLVFDDSGSMKAGQRFPGADYSLQTLVALLNPEDELLIVNLSRQKLFEANLKDKQKDINVIKKWKPGGGTPWSAVEIMMEKIRQSPRTDKCLIILTDGHFDGLQKDHKDLNRNVKNAKAFMDETGTKVLILNINTAENELLALFDKIGQAEIYETDNTLEEIVSQMNKISTAAMFIPSGGVAANSNGKTVTIKTPIPLKRLIVIEQVTSRYKDLNSLEAAKSPAQNLGIEGPFNSEFDDLKGRITHIKSATQNTLISAGQLDLVFKDEVDLSRFKFLPEAAAKLEARIISKVQKREGNIDFICKEENEIEVEAQLLTLDGTPIPIETLRQSKVTIKHGRGIKKLAFYESDMAFKGMIPVTEERMTFSVTAEYDKFFDFRSNVFIVEKMICPRQVEAKLLGDFKQKDGNLYVVCDEVKTLSFEGKLLNPDGSKVPEADLVNASIRISYESGVQKDVPIDENQLFKVDLELYEDNTVLSVAEAVEGAIPIDLIIKRELCPKFTGEDVVVEIPKFKVTDICAISGTRVKPFVTMNGRDISEAEFEMLYLEPIEASRNKLEVRKEDGMFVIKPVGKWWCNACLNPVGRDSATYRMQSKGHQLEGNAQLTVVLNIEDVPFLEKCWNLILWAIILFFFLIYLYGILSKKRFASSALISYKRIMEYIPSRERTYELKTSFFNRYLIPFLPEKKTVQGVTFVAGEDSSFIVLPKKYQQKRMYIQNNLIEKPKERDRSIIANAKLEIRRKGGRIDEYLYKK